MQSKIDHVTRETWKTAGGLYFSDCYGSARVGVLDSGASTFLCAYTGTYARTAD